MAENRMIGVCDILGFSKLVKNNPADDVVSYPLALLRRALYFSIHQKPPPSELPSLDTLREQRRVGFAWFSDTMLFYTVKDTDEDCRALIETVGWLIFSTIPSPHIRIRSAIAYGEMHIDEKNSIYLGPPLIEAHELERQQDWAGGALDESAERRIPPHLPHKYPYEWQIVRYDVPP
jgi:hypothetical protein